MAIGTGFQRSACATARTARGCPRSLASRLYDTTAPYGMLAVRSSTFRWNGLLASRRSSAHSRCCARPSTYARKSR